MKPIKLTPQLRDKIWQRFSILTKEAGGVAALSRKTGIPRTLVYDWKKRGDPRISHLVMIHDACGVSLDWLLGFTDERGAENG